MLFLPASTILIFTDGACTGNPGPGGWGSIILTPDGQVTELGGRAPATTNNRMEILGTINALEFVRGKVAPVMLFTDSTYVIRGITQWIYGWQKKGWQASNGKEVANQDLWQELLAVVRKRGKEGAVDWRYARGHTGIPGNERCDEIAVGFANGKSVKLYRGPLLKYDIDLNELPQHEELPEMKSNSGEKKAAPYGYVSLVGGVAMRHSTWPECERRVRGQSGAKFKKVMTASEETALLKSWGIDPGKVK